jgi:hypothetical protein
VGTFLLRRFTGRLKRSEATLPERVVDAMLGGASARGT